MKLERFKVGDELTKLGRKLNLLVDYCKAITPKRGENTRVRQTHAGAYISADKTAVSAVGGAAGNSQFITSITHEGSSVFTVVLTEIEVTYPYSIIQTVSAVTWQFQLSGSTARVNFYVEPTLGAIPAYKWRVESGTIVGNDATTIAAQSTSSFIPEGLLEFSDVLFQSTGQYTIYSNTFPTLEVTRLHDSQKPTFRMVNTGGASKLLAVDNVLVMNASNGAPSAPDYILLADGTYSIYVGWDSSSSTWKLTDTISTYQCQFLVGSVEITSNEITAQSMYTGQLSLPNVGLANETRNFDDNGGNSHSVTIVNGIITAWTIT